MQDPNLINKTDKVHIAGINEQKITALGSFIVHMKIDDIIVPNKFFIMPNDLNIPVHGILGKDFLKHRSIIDNIDFKLTLKLDSAVKVIPIQQATINELNILFAPAIDRSHTVLHELNRNNPNMNEKIKDLCTRFNHIFYLKGDKLTTNNFFKYTLKLSDAAPVYIKNYRTIHSQKPIIDSSVNELLQNDLIEPSYAPYNSPVQPVPKKSDDGKIQYRLVNDYRGVNKKLIHDKYPLPRMDDILDELGDNKYFSIIDLKSGFHQIELTPDCRDMTTFSTQAGSFRYKVLPFGLKVSPSAFSRMIAAAFSTLPYNVCFTYLDDIIIVGKSETEHLENIAKVFGVCERLCLKLNPKKCTFFATEVTYLGHKCTTEGIMPDDSKYHAIKFYPRPQSKDESKRFVAFMNYFRKFIKNFAALAAPINKNMRKTEEFNWTKECEDSFNKFKSILTSPNVLYYPDFTQPFVITCDASKIACGSVLSQIRNGIDVPIAYHSQPFTKGESNKAPIEQELLAIYYSIKYFRPYIYGTRFKVRSDHRPLIYLFSLKDPASRLTRIRIELEEHDFEIEYIRGETNVVADALSRVTINDLKQLNAYVYAITRSMTRASSNVTNSGSASAQIDENAQAQNALRGDERISDPNIMAYEPLETKSYLLPHMKSYGVVDILERADTRGATLNVYKTQKSLKPLFTVMLPISVDTKTIQLGKALERLDGLAEGHNIPQITFPLCDPLFVYVAPDVFKTVANSYLKNTKILLKSKPKTIYDEAEKQNILQRFHEDPIFGGHPGQQRLHAKIASAYQWKNLRKDVANFVQKCALCQINKPKRANIEPLCLTATPQQPFDRVVIDTLGPLVTSERENTYALTAVCDLTKYVVTVPIPNKQATTIAKALMNEIVLIYGPMKSILSDKGTEFLNSTVNELCSMLKIEKIHSTAYHHQTVGSIERNHRSLNEYLRAYINDAHGDWEELLKFFTYCYNATPHSAFNFAYSPFELVFAKKPVDFASIVGNSIEPIYNVDNFAKESKFKLQLALNQAKELLNKSKLQAKKYYDRKMKQLNIKVGDKVVLNDFTKHKILDPMYKGPYTILEDKNFNLLLKNDANNKIIEAHKNNVKKYH